MKIAARLLVALTLAGGVASAGMLRSAAAERRPASAPHRVSRQAADPRGQTATRLPDGRWLVVGGEIDGQPVATARVIDLATGAVKDIALPVARAWHTATVLADGTVLIAGGNESGGQPAAGSEIFDPVTATFTPLAMTGALARSGATATLLIDGRVIVAGGRGADSRPLPIEVWDLDRHAATPLGASTSRAHHTATLLPDGRVLLSGGVDVAGRTLDAAEIVDPADGRIAPAAPPPAIDTSRPVLAASVPADGAQDVRVDARLALRFSKALAFDTIAPAITVAGPDGPVAMTFVVAEGGRLVFVTPGSALAPDTTYALTIDGATDERGVAVAAATITFTTKAADATSTSPEDAEAWLPDAAGRDGWRTNRPDSPWRNLAPLVASPGTTAISGQVLRLDGKPLADVTLGMDGHDARSDRTGRFLLLLPGVAGGRHELEIDGRTANRPHRTYGTFEYGLDVAPGRTTVLPFTIWMPLIDVAHEVTIASPTMGETVITTPFIPGLELHLPAGTVVKDDDGHVVRTISLTPVPVDRPPFPLAKNVDVPVYFTIQPGGAYVQTPSASAYTGGAWLVYPNYRHEYPGKRLQFFHYDPPVKAWYVYGLGTVTANGAQAVPDPSTRFRTFTGAMLAGGPAPPNAADPPNCCPTQDKGGDPVGLGTGLFSLEQTDLYIADTLPLALTRTYRSRDSESRPFGYGATHPYAMYLYAVSGYTQTDLILPDGAKIHYVRVSQGSTWTDAVFQHVETGTTSATPTAFYKSVITWRSEPTGWDLTLKDGTVYMFGENAPLQGIRDRYGNTITIAHAIGQIGNITRITSPHGRWMAFTYEPGPNGTSRITQIKDNIGRTVGYQYDANGNLWKVTDPTGGVTSYTYDTSHNLLTVQTPRFQGTTTYLVTNEYTTSADNPTPVGWVKKQTHADTGFYSFAYTFDAVTGKITRTDVTDPLSHVRRVTFNGDGYVLQDTHAWNLPEQQTVVSDRPSRDNFVRTTTDPHGLQTTMTYDAMGNLMSVTRLSNTQNPVTTNYTYEPRFNQIKTVEDPLHHITTYGYDDAGNLTSVTDPLQHATTFGYNSQGQRTSVTDALQHMTTFGYTGGDLTTITDPLMRTTTRFTDAVGRVLSVTNSIGDTTRYTYDANDRVKTVTGVLNGVTSFDYFPDGQLQAITDANQHTTTYTYDAMGRMNDRIDPLDRKETFTYDLNGNAYQWRDRKGQLTTRTYDPLDRLHQVTYDDTSTITYTYDDRDRLTQITDSASSGSITRAYDDLNRLLSETTPQGVVSYTYDNADRRATMTVQGQSDVVYTFDNADRLTRITQSTLNVTLQFDNANRRTVLTLPNGVVTEYGYDDANQLTGLTYRTAVATLGTLTYDYDLTGRRTTLGGTWARTGLPQPVASATYDPANELTAWGSQVRSYDPNGNLASDGLTSYTWNARNQLVGMNGDTTLSFAYDSIERRRAKTASGTSTTFLYDGANLVQELSGTTPTANLLTGLAIDETFMRTEASATSTLLVDALGSSLAVADASGTVQASYSYQPFGATATSGTVGANRHQFTGRENDDSRLYYYRARYYDTSTARFVSEDPIREWAGVNFYPYVGNQPTTYIDPDGLLQLCCRPVNMPGLRQLGAKHCFIKLSDGTTLGGYNRRMLLRPEANATDDTCPKDKPECSDLPGKEADVRKAWNDLPKGPRIYGLDGTSNTIPIELLENAGIPSVLPPGAVANRSTPLIGPAMPGLVFIK